MSKTGRPSSVETHPERVAIEACLARKTPLRTIAGRYGLKVSSLHRHRLKLKATNPKVFAAMTAADWGVTPAELERLKTETADGWLKVLRSQIDKLVKAQDDAIEDDRLSIAASLAGRVHEVLAMLGKATDNLRDHATVQHSHLHYSVEFLDFRTKVIEALRPFPEARSHLLAVLHGAEDDGEAVEPVAVALPAPSAPMEAMAA